MQQCASRYDKYRTQPLRTQTGALYDFEFLFKKYQWSEYSQITKQTMAALAVQAEVHHPPQEYDDQPCMILQQHLVIQQ